MIKEVKGFLKRKQEIIIVIIISILILLCFILFIDAPKIYNDNSLNPLILNIFGTLFGLLLTSYAILFGLIPALSIDTLETNAIESVNFRFFISLIINLIIIVNGFVIIFLPETLLIYLQLFLVTFLVLMFFLLIFYLFVLFKGARNKAIKDKNKKINPS
mgnify:CR=1 FL=1